MKCETDYLQEVVERGPHRFLSLGGVGTSVSDPHPFFADPDPT
jgi:hypothetical protein